MIDRRLDRIPLPLPEPGLSEAAEAVRLEVTDEINAANATLDRLRSEAHAILSLTPEATTPEHLEAAERIRAEGDKLLLVQLRLRGLLADGWFPELPKARMARSDAAMKAADAAAAKVRKKLIGIGFSEELLGEENIESRHPIIDAHPSVAPHLAEAQAAMRQAHDTSVQSRNVEQYRLIHDLLSRAVRVAVGRTTF